LWTTLNHLWLDPEVVAHDVIATKVGYLNFPFGFRAIFFWVDGIYIDITRLKNCRAQDEANDDSFYKKL
jgi:hypothetical protein